MGQILMNSFHVLLALLFIVSPVCAGIFAAIGYMRKKELKKLHKTLEELRRTRHCLIVLQQSSRLEKLPKDRLRLATVTDGRKDAANSATGRKMPGTTATDKRIIMAKRFDYE